MATAATSQTGAARMAYPGFYLLILYIMTRSGQRSLGIGLAGDCAVALDSGEDGIDKLWP